MFGSGRNGELRLVLADFILVLALFWGVAYAVSGDHNRAHAVPLLHIEQQVGTEDRASARIGLYGPLPSHFASNGTQPGRERELLLLSVALAAIAALNLAFLRHLRRVYASPRRSVWRRGRQG
jgi:hypothetical protein